MEEKYGLESAASPWEVFALGGLRLWDRVHRFISPPKFLPVCLIRRS